MKIINKKPRLNGGYNTIQTWSGAIPPETHYRWYDNLDTTTFYEYNGFVNLTVIRGMVVSYEPNIEAWEAWKASLPTEPTDPEDPGTTDMSEYATWNELATAFREGVNLVE